MNKKELEEMIEVDLAIDRTKLETESAEQPIRHYKYIRLLGEAKLELKKLENRLKQVKADRFKFYIGKHPEEVSDTIYEKSELKPIMEGDHKVLEVEARLFIQKELVDLLAQVCEVFKARQFSIKNILDTRRLEAGL